MTGSIRVAAVGDLHCTKASQGALQALFTRIAESADVLALCGDLTDRGLADEARILAKELGAIKMPKVAVLGNHDFESDAAADVTEILAQADVPVLDGTAVEIAGVGFAGAKGFAGGFGELALQAWGEEPIKTFVRASVDETLKL
jgi:Icc-related predicted phosphoesterase